MQKKMSAAKREAAKRAFADLLQEWREREGLTQAQAAEFLNVPRRSYEAWEGAVQMPDQRGPILRLIAGDAKPPAA